MLNYITCTPTDNTDDILNELYVSLFHYYEEKTVICRTDSSYVFHSIDGFSMHIHKIDLRRGSSFIPSPKWLQSKKSSINPKYMDDNYCFAYATAIAIYYKELGSHINRITNKLIKHVNKINWNGIDFPASALDYKTFEQINEDIALNILYVPFDQMDICQEYISKHNFTRKIQVIF